MKAVEKAKSKAKVWSSYHEDNIKIAIADIFEKIEKEIWLDDVQRGKLLTLKKEELGE